MAVAAAMPSKEVMKTTSQSAKVARPRSPMTEPNQGRPFRPRSEMRLISAAKFVHLEVPRRKNHWGRLIQSNQTGMLFGPRGRGKTWVALSLAICISACIAFLGRKGRRARRVIYLDGEMDLFTLRQRILSLCRSFNVDPPSNLKLFTPEAFTDLLPSINTAEGQRAIDEMIGTDWDVIFIDNYSAWSGDGRETAEAWAPMMRWMLGHKRAGRTVIVIHHTGKTGKQRGSSSHEDALDWSVALKPVEDVAGDGALRFNLVWEKSRHLANTEVQPIAATLRQDENGDVSWHHKEGLHRDPRIEKALAMKVKGLSQVAIADELGIDRTTVGRWLKTK